MKSNAERLRNKVSEILNKKVFPHQRFAANNTFSALGPDCRCVIMAAEMQSGKSGVALALACLQRNSLTDIEIVNQSMLKDTVYVLTMPNKDLLAQAKDDLRPCMNVEVTNMQGFEKSIEKYFYRYAPKLIIIDECHYGSNEKAVRYEKLFDYIEKKNVDCNVVFISATPLSALLAAENDAILRQNLHTKLVFHKASDEYHGIKKMKVSNQVVSLNGHSRNIMNHSPERNDFVNHMKTADQAGWALIRVPSGSAMDAKSMLIKEGFDKENIFILGGSLSGVPSDELMDVDQFKIEYEQGMMFDKQMIAITVAGVRAGINFGQSMKENLLATWDSTVSSVAAIVQANIGRACGYHANKSALHFTNKSGVESYAAIVSYLEDNCSTHATNDLEGLRDVFEKVCDDYEIRGLDAGTRINKGKKNTSNSKIFEYKAHATDSYLVVPGMLEEDGDYSAYTDDSEYLKSIAVVREVLLKDGVKVKDSRSLPPKSNSIANWVNGDTFKNAEKANAGGPVFERVSTYTTSLDLDRNVNFNDIIPAGGGVNINERSVAVYVFSIYNKSKRSKIDKTVMTRSEVEEVSLAYGIPKDNTVLVLFKKGEFSERLTSEFIDKKLIESEKSKIVEASKFKRNWA